MGKNWFEKFFSIDEFRYSALVIVLFIVIGAMLTWLFIHGTVPVELVGLAETLILSIAGVNAVGKFTSLFGKSDSNNTTSSSNSSTVNNSSVSYGNIERGITDTSIKPKI